MKWFRKKVEPKIEGLVPVDAFEQNVRKMRINHSSNVQSTKSTYHRSFVISEMFEYAADNDLPITISLDVDDLMSADGWLNHLRKTTQPVTLVSNNKHWFGVLGNNITLTQVGHPLRTAIVVGECATCVNVSQLNEPLVKSVFTFDNYDLTQYVQSVIIQANNKEENKLKTLVFYYNDEAEKTTFQTDNAPVLERLEVLYIKVNPEISGGARIEVLPV